VLTVAGVFLALAGSLFFVIPPLLEIAVVLLDVLVR